MDIESLYEKFLQSGKVSTDTRQITPGSVFFALKGPHFNANTFALEALEKGAGYAVVDEKEFARHDRTILVEDGLRCLQQLAQHHRDQFNIPVIGLTGSNGKTTTKELIHAVLSKKYNTLATKGNLNNHIGVPLTLLELTQATEMAVVEMGANHVREIAWLSELASPTHGLITNIGRAHLGPFGGFENIVQAKSELYDYLITHEGQAFVNSQNPVLANLSKRFTSPLSYPATGDYCHVELISAEPFLKLKTEGGPLETQLIGGYNFENAAAALCVGKYFGVDPAEADGAVAAYVPGSMRSQVVRQGTNMIILDAYNANPSSMAAAIENLAGMKATRKVAILGDMYELEDESDAEHKKLGEVLLANKIEEVYLCGSFIKKALETYPRAKYFATKTELVFQLRQDPIQNATILIKASRGMGMETIMPVLH